MNRRRLLLAAGALPALSFRSPGVPAPDRKARARLEAVLKAARTFGRGGGYDRSWKSSGCPAAVMHKGERILSGSESGTYCCGFTFAVAVKALQDGGELDRASADDVRRFQKVWYGATKKDKERERQCAVAVKELGVGREVKVKDAQAGDFLQLWRRGNKPSGHSVLFLGWVMAGDDRVGISYLSSQGSTDGIGYAVEYLSDEKLGAVDGAGRVDPDRLWFARLDL